MGSGSMIQGLTPSHVGILLHIRITDHLDHMAILTQPVAWTVPCYVQLQVIPSPGDATSSCITTNTVHSLHICSLLSMQCPCNTHATSHRSTQGATQD